MASKARASQKERVLKLLQAGRKITQAQARTWNILSLSSTVRKLRDDGHPISNELFRNRRGHHAVRYVLTA